MLDGCDAAAELPVDLLLYWS